MGLTHKINVDKKLDEAQELFKSNNYKKTIEVCDVIIKNRPDYVQSHIIKGYALGDLGMHQEAIKNYDLAIKYKPDFALAYFNKGLLLAKNSRHQEVDQFGARKLSAKVR